MLRRMWLLLVACQSPEEKVTPEALDLPEDPAEQGVPVGVRSFTDAEVSVEIWYPASESVAGQVGEDADFNPYISEAVRSVLGDFSLPLVPTVAVREAPLRVPEVPYPVVVFSHGMGGTRLQSVDYTTHLASRGYVVIAAEHPGRMMGDIVPCLFSPPLEGCDLSGMGGEDPADDDVRHVADLVEGWATDGWLAGAIDPEKIGLSGHSAGAGTTATTGPVDERFDALLPMGAAVASDTEKPQLVMDGVCDSIIPDADVQAEAEAAGVELVRISGAGHLAFSDLCELQLLDFANTYLVDREDVNSAILGLLVQLASDGCPESTPPAELDCPAYLPLETSDEIIRYYSTVFFDDALYARGPGVEKGIFPEAL